MGSVADPRNTPLPSLTVSNVFNLRNYGDPPEKKLTPRVTPFKIIQGHRNQRGSIGYDLPLVI